MSTAFENLILRDSTANRPAAGKPGRLFYDTTLEKWERDNGSSWDDCEPAATALSDLTDVNIVAPSVGDVLTWDGSEWESAAPTGGGGATVTDDILAAAAIFNAANFR